METKIENEVLDILDKNNSESIDKLRERLRLEQIQISANLHLCGVIEMINKIGAIMEENKEELSNVEINLATGSKARASKKLDFYVRILFTNKETRRNIATSSSKALTNIHRIIENCEYFDIDHSGTFHDSNSLHCLSVDLSGNKEQFYEIFISKNLMTNLMKIKLESELSNNEPKKVKAKI